jgi:pyruvate dehydrogenase E2 component (dihydrolipoamide acetyltransferase)
MPYEFKLPDIGEGVVEGEIVRWLVAEGEEVRADQPMVEVMTDKATVEIPAPRAGRIVKRMFAEGQICPVGQVLVSIDEGAGAAAPTARPQRTTPGVGPGAIPPVATTTPSASPSPAAATSPATTTTTTTTPSTAQVLATPATRKLARELDVDLARVPGSGPAGRITSDDVRAHAGGDARSNGGAGRAAYARPPQIRRPDGPAEADVRVPFRGVRRKIAEHLVKAKHTAAHYTYVEEIDCTQLVGLREKANARLAGEKLKLSFLPFIIRATVEALRRFPQMNDYLDEAAGEIVQRRQYHMGLATATADGLIVPVLRDADRATFPEIEATIRNFAARAKDGSLTLDDLRGGTFSITNGGVYGSLMSTPIVNPPQVAILGLHAIKDRPAAVNGQVVLRPMMYLALTYDHRIVDGAEAVRFLVRIKELIEDPAALVIET